MLRSATHRLRPMWFLRLGCIGNRVYTGLGEDELYFVVRGKDLSALADALDVIMAANIALREYAWRAPDDFP